MAEQCEEDSASCIFESPVGRLQIKATFYGICSLSWLKEGQQIKREDMNGKDCAFAREHLTTCTNWLTAYFNGSLLKFPVPKPPIIFPKKGTFSHHVWCTLCCTEVGDTLSYGQLASLAGHPRAARAVGQAMRSNSIPLLIPCHRVVKSGDGGLGNYSGGDGTSTKQWLLDHESRMATAHNTIQNST